SSETAGPRMESRPEPAAVLSALSGAEIHDFALDPRTNRFPGFTISCKGDLGKRIWAALSAAFAWSGGTHVAHTRRACRSDDEQCGLPHAGTSARPRLHHPEPPRSGRCGAGAPGRPTGRARERAATGP